MSVTNHSISVENILQFYPGYKIYMIHCLSNSSKSVDSAIILYKTKSNFTLELFNYADETLERQKRFGLGCYDVAMGEFIDWIKQYESVKTKEDLWLDRQIRKGIDEGILPGNLLPSDYVQDIE